MGPAEDAYEALSRKEHESHAAPVMTRMSTASHSHGQSYPDQRQGEGVALTN